jgi:hypothetical protein
MLFGLIATVAAGLAGAGIAMLLRRLSGGQLPRYIVPGTAGAAMFAFLIWNEYTWYSRTAAALPEGVVVFSSYPERMAWRPWTLLAPVTERFAAVDRGSIRRNENLPSQVMADVLLIGRRAPVARLPVLVDCDGPRRAEIPGGPEFDADGTLANANWTDLPPDDPLAGAVCSDT